MSEIAKYGGGGVTVVSRIDPDVLRSLEGFTAHINEPPPSTDIKINSAANNSKYVPISHVQMRLDEMFFGLWNFEVKHVQVIANEIIGHGMLEIYHPVAHVWLRRSGSAAVMIQQKSAKNGGTGDLTNIGDKIKNTLVKDFPHLEAEILKSAAKKFGKAFGRDLNRDFEDSYEPEIKTSTVLSDVMPKLEACGTIEELMQLWGNHEDLHQNARFKLAFSTRKQEIKNGKASV